MIERFHELGASAILRTSDETLAAPAMHAAVEAGFRVVEFTLTTPGALARISEFARIEGLVVGAGTVLTVDQAQAAVDAGASFLVSPVVDEAVIESALALGATPIPGAHTPTELYRAHRAGAPLQKLFPAPANVATYVRACLGPLPFLRLVPTNGVDETNVAEVLAAGAYAVGFVAPLFNAAELESRNWELVRRRAQRLLAAVDAARATSALST